MSRDFGWPGGMGPPRIPKAAEPAPLTLPAFAASLMVLEAARGQMQRPSHVKLGLLKNQAASRSASRTRGPGMDPRGA
ncbi:hypothetical protein KRR55_19520 [Paeniglutamicibacter sp. ABSL32-1]|uniref:hypothetical protein n=1 Tax=Paeniglutamicibacter quisquiliarum TaxID=2849498 RepID=UPI001C2D27E6|nr:hypothetical protein [Paeniglutamicibacter quisquiliarum]MBV1781304.1 hypothetical protein [Paeniglutamicibacter quisquiliarum]